MAPPKLPKSGHAPIIGRQEQVLACVYVIGAGPGPSPVKVGACLDIARTLDEMQRASHRLLQVHDLCWFPDLRIAKRVAAGAHTTMRTGGRHIRGEWFDVAPRKAAVWIAESARSLDIPLLSNDQYRKICASPAQRADNEFTNFLRSVGITRT